MRACALVVLLVANGLSGGAPQERFAEGELKGFTRSPTEHIIVRLEKPITVRGVEGVVALGGGPGVPPTAITDALFEIRGPGASGTVRGTLVDDNGKFKLRGVKEGTYAFKATRDGFQSVVGTLIVSKKAPKGDKIEIRMPLGV